jgi:hypothetical protein
MDCQTPRRPVTTRPSAFAIAPQGTRPAHAAEWKPSPERSGYANHSATSVGPDKADAVVSVDERRIVSVRAGRGGIAVECLCGHVWVTQEGSGDDVIVPPGQTFTTRRPGKVVVQAYAPALVRIVRR